MGEIIDQENVESLFGNSLVAFQTSDLKELAAQIIKRANEVAQQKIAAAAQTAASQEKSAYEAGMAKGVTEGEKKGEAAGRAAGEKAAREEFVKSVTGVAAALKASVVELNKRKMQLQADAEADMLHLAMAIAKRIVRHEMTVNEGAVLPVVREAISLCNNRSDLALRLNPADINAVQQEIPSLQGVFTDLGRVDLRPDPAVERGGVLLQNSSNAVDLRLSQQFAALERALAGVEDNLFDHLPPPPAGGLTPEEAEIMAPSPAAPEPQPAAPVAAPATSAPAAPLTPPAATSAAAPVAAAAPAAGGLSSIHRVQDIVLDAATTAAVAAVLRG